MPDLLSLEMFIRHLKVPSGAEEESDLDMKRAQAEALVLAYIARPDDEDYTAVIASWTDKTVPKAVQAAILIQATELYRFRGDDEKGPARDFGALSPQTVAILTAAGYRRPVVV